MDRETRQLTLQDLIRVLSRRKWLILFCVLGIGAAGTFFSFALPETYRSSTVFLLKDPKYVASLYGAALLNVPYERRLSTIEEDIRAFSSVNDVVEDLDLARAGRSPSEVGRRIIENLEVSVLPSRRGDTTVVLAYTDTSPSRAANVVNRVRDRYITSQVDGYREQVKARLDRIDEQLARQKKAQAEALDALRKFEEKHPLDVASRTSKSQGDLARLEREIERAERSLDSKKRELASTRKKLKTTPQVEDPSERKRNKRYDDLLEKVIQKRRTVARLEDLFTEKYVPLQTERTDLKRLEEELKQVEEFIVVQKEKRKNVEYLRLEETARTLQAEIDGLEKSKKDLERQARLLRITVRDLPRQREAYRGLEKAFESHSKAIAESLRLREKARFTWDVARESAGTHYEVIDPARPPLAPTGPHRLLWFLGSLAAGLAVGLGISVLLHLLSQALTTVEEARSFLEVPVMGTVPTIRSALELQRDRRRRAMALALVMIVVFSGAAFTLVYTQFPEILPGFVRDSISTIRDRLY